MCGLNIDLELLIAQRDCLLKLRKTSTSETIDKLMGIVCLLEEVIDQKMDQQERKRDARTYQQ